MPRLDIDGDGAPDNEATLAAWGIDQEELQSLARAYGTSQLPKGLWRFRASHFTAFDLNVARAAAGGDQNPPGESPGPQPQGGGPPPTCHNGSIIKCESQALGQELKAAGTPFTLVYDSARTEGYGDNFSVEVPVNFARGNVLAAGDPLVKIRVRMEIAGKTYVQERQGSRDLSNFALTWDGKDVFGRTVSGPQSARITLSFDYEALYSLYLCTLTSNGGSICTPPTFRFMDAQTAKSSRAFRIPGEVQELIRPMDTKSRSWVVSVGSHLTTDLGLGGWAIDAHHHYDKDAGILTLGDGRRIVEKNLPKTLKVDFKEPTVPIDGTETAYH
ncbi:MAG: hypothetical protein WCO71_13890, partial [Pseudomonadota bacterium]